MLKCVKAEGKGDVEHKPPISANDLKRRYQHATTLDQETPKGLSRKVWFELVLYFCRRGRENLRELTPSHFEVCRDDLGRKYVKKAKSERTKNPQGDSNEENLSGGRMYETGILMCPILPLMLCPQEVVHVQCVVSAYYAAPYNNY